MNKTLQHFLCADCGRATTIATDDPGFGLCDCCERRLNSQDSLIVTDGDRVLCENCYLEQQDEQDPATYFYAYVKHGVCDSCGLEIKKENVKGNLPVKHI